MDTKRLDNRAAKEKQEAEREGETRLVFMHNVPVIWSGVFVLQAVNGILFSVDEAQLVVPDFRGRNPEIIFGHPCANTCRKNKESQKLAHVATLDYLTPYLRYNVDLRVSVLEMRGHGWPKEP